MNQLNLFDPWNIEMVQQTWCLLLCLVVVGWNLMGHDDVKLHFFWSLISSVQQGMQYKSAISFNNKADFYDEKVIRKT